MLLNSTFSFQHYFSIQKFYLHNFKKIIKQNQFAFNNI